MNAAGRLHPVISIEDTRPDYTGGATPPASYGGHASALSPSYNTGLASEARDGSDRHTPDYVRGAGVEGPRVESSSSAGLVERQHLDQLCLRAERDGPAGWARALPLISHHVHNHAGDAQAWTYLARGSMAQGQEAEAMQAAQRALRIEPDVALGYSVHLLVARSSAEASDWEASERHCEAALASQPGDVEALELLATAYFAQDVLPKAEAALGVLARSSPERSARLAHSFAKQSSAAPEHQHLWLSRAVDWAREEDRPFCELGEVCLLLQRDMEAAQWLQKALLQTPGNAGLAHSLAQLQLRAGCVEEALQVYRSAMRVSPGNYHLHRQYGQLLLQEGRSAEAIDAIKHAASMAPPQDTAALCVTLAELQQSVGQKQEALITWQSVIALDAGNVNALRGLAVTAALTGNDKEELRALTELRRWEPQNADWPAKLGMLQLRMRREEDARGQFAWALQLCPNHPLALLGKARTSSGSEALELYERACCADPSSEEALEEAAGAHWSRGKRGEAAHWYRKLLARRPDDSRAQVRAAIGCLLQQNPREAYTLLARAVDREQPSHEAIAWFGYTQLLLGQVDRAVASFQVAMQHRGERHSHGQVHLYWAAALMELCDAAGAEEQFALATRSHPALLRVLATDPDAAEASSARRHCIQTLSEDLPGIGQKLSAHLEVLLQRHLSSSTPPGVSIPPVSHLAGNHSNDSSTPKKISPPAVVVQPMPVKAAPPQVSETWRGELHEGRAVEVYSKSAKKWIDASVVQQNADMVRLKYLIDGHWCEKVLLVSSEFLRLKPATPERELRGGGPPALRLPATPPTTPQARSRGLGPPKSPVLMAPTMGADATPKASLGHREVKASGDIAKQVPKPASAPSASSIRSCDAAGEKPPTDTPPSSVTPLQQRGNTGIAASETSKPGRGTSSEAFDPPARRQWVAPAPSTSPATTSQSPKRAPSPSQKPELLDPSQLSFGPVLGTGGFGAVYRGTYRGDEVAIKKLHASDGNISPLQMEEFRKEVANLQSLRHERLVSLIGACFVPPSFCIVTEFMQNGSLYELLHHRKTALVFEQRLRIATDIVEGVAFLHSKSPPFVHRDLKSLNVVLDLALRAKLCDFGLTQSMEKTHISRRENEGGSPRYMAPELFDSKLKITEKVDIWALGCLAVEVFTARVPHEECTKIQQVMIKTLVNKEMPYQDWTGAPLELRRLAELCFVFDARQRTGASTLLEGIRGLRP